MRTVTTKKSQPVSKTNRCMWRRKRTADFNHHCREMVRSASDKRPQEALWPPTAPKMIPKPTTQTIVCLNPSTAWSPMSIPARKSWDRHRVRLKTTIFQQKNFLAPPQNFFLEISSAQSGLSGQVVICQEVNNSLSFPDVHAYVKPMPTKMPTITPIMKKTRFVTEAGDLGGASHGTVTAFFFF